MERVRFTSGGFWLEGVLGQPQGRPRLAAVIAHPHPQFGGSMDNNVVHALFDALVGSGALALRFNFRGVGGSEGGCGELTGAADDVLAAAQYLESAAASGPCPLVLAGYSFGGLAALHALAKGLAPGAIILVSPMVPEGGFEKDAGLKNLFPLKVPLLVLSGGRDEFYDHRLYQPMVKASAPGSRLVVVDDADHFWAGLSAEIKAAVMKWGHL